MYDIHFMSKVRDTRNFIAKPLQTDVSLFTKKKKKKKKNSC